MKISKIGSVAALSLVLALPSGVAYAKSNGAPSVTLDDNGNSALIVELVEKNPGTSYADMERAVRSAARATGASEAEVARQALAEVDLQAAQIRPRSGAKPSDDKGIGMARHRGDVFYTPSKSFGINHGHSGIYSYPQWIVEALPGKGVAEHFYAEVKVSSGAHKQSVSTSQGNRNRAANRARDFIGKWYSPNFAFNKTANGPMNCSQVVWAAYKTATGIDLDSNGGHGVYPSDILNSRYTVTYQRF
ncbi:YiiX/YebB-like N1pC/P60 family cysteine hydrolase [Trueperella pyogenes]|uniref:YiiX/YebB-like N1pC/P60 family cysteine hydrolase n=1 Tax=Trueperella pyogenes TaxID=1661 RepID=UPI00345D35B3